MAKQDTRKHSLEVEAGRHLMGEAALLGAEWAEMERRAALGGWDGIGEGQHEERCGVRRRSGLLGEL